MSRVFWKLLVASPAALAVSGLFGGAAFAVQDPAADAPTSVAVVGIESLIAVNQQPAIELPTQPDVIAAPVAPSPVLAQSLRGTPSVADLEAPLPTLPNTPAAGQVTSVTQLSDLKPTDWAYQAVQSLVERYGCIVGYPNSTFRGNRAATRFELAAALNACLDVISDRFATKEDLLAVRRLQEEFAKELATLKGRINNLEGRTAKLESQQFSTTTKLRGVAVVSFSNALLGDDASTNASVAARGDNPIVSYRARLNLDTSFSGKDLLRTRLQAGNVPNYNTVAGLYNTARLSYDVPTDNGTFTLDKLYYRFPVFGKGTVQVDALRAELYEGLMNTFNPYLASADTGSLSRFFRFNPVYFAAGDAGISISYPFLQHEKRDLLRVTVGYHGGLAVPANAAACTTGTQSPACFGAGQPVRFDQGTGDGGLFGGPYSASVQIESAPLSNLRVGVFYSYTYGIDVSGATGTSFASNPLGGGLQTRDQTSNNFGVQAFYQPIKQLGISGWAGVSRVEAGSASAAVGIPNEIDATILNWAVTLAAPDLWRKGDLASLSFGMPPQVIESGDLTREDRDTTYMLQALYRFQINPNISVTPGIIAVFNPNGNSNALPGDKNDTTVMGVLRTTFTF